MIWNRKRVDFAAQFAGGEPIEYQGRRLWSAYRAPTKPGDRWLIDFENFTTGPVQGLSVAGRESAVQLQIAKRRSEQFVLWTDTAPRHVQVLVTSAPEGAEIAFWNVWKDEKHGTMLYGVNAAALEIEHCEDNSVLLRCSDGWKGPDFRDLVVRIRKNASDCVQ